MCRICIVFAVRYLLLFIYDITSAGDDTDQQTWILALTDMAVVQSQQKWPTHFKCVL